MQELANAIKNGDERAFRTFFLDAYPRVLQYLERLLPDNLFTDDIAQEVFIRLWRHRDQLDPQRPLDPWLFTIARNTAYTHVQKLLADKLNRQAVTAPEAADDTSARLDYKESLSRYRLAASGIEPRQLRCFLLHRERGLSYREIAEHENISIKTVEKYISQVLRHLREAFAIVQIGILLKDHL